MEEPVSYPITGELDLHSFHPKDVPELLPEYLRLCREKGILKVRIVHGKGIGAMREMVHALLKRNPDVEQFAMASEALGGWGATIVALKPSSHRSVSQ